MTERMMMGATPHAELHSARLQLHHAVQVLAAFGQTFVEPRDDDSHRSMTWDHSCGCFLSEPAPEDGGLRVGLAPAGLSISLWKYGRIMTEARHLGSDLESLYAWVESEIGQALRLDFPVRLDRPEYDLPDHAVARGGSFPRSGVDGLHELFGWFDYAAAELHTLLRRDSRATAVHCWPHHFDLATLLPLDGATGAGPGKSIGVGFSPGDGGIDRPYWYVNGYPDPKPRDIPAPPAGSHWNTEGWFGAVLTGDRVLAGADATARSALTQTFFEQAINSIEETLSLGE